jgi:hypothetical protein
LTEHIAPGTAPSHSDLEPAHLLHDVDLIVCVLYARVLGQQALTNRWCVGRDELSDFVVAFGVPFFFVVKVLEAGIPWGESVGPHVEVFRDDVQRGGFGVVPVKAEEAAGKVFGGVNYALGLAGPEVGMRLDKVLIASAKAYACGEGA